MDVSKLGPGQRIAAGAAVLLFIDLFLSWYSAGAYGISISADAWEVFSWTDLLLALTVIVALAMAAQAMGVLSIPVRLSTILLPLAGVMTLIVLYRLINQPGPNKIISNEFGAYLGFVLIAAVTYGAFRAQNEHEEVAPSGTYRAGNKSATTAPPAASTPPAPAAPPAATTPAPTEAPPASEEPPPPPPASTTP